MAHRLHVAPSRVHTTIGHALKESVPTYLPPYLAAQSLNSAPIAPTPPPPPSPLNSHLLLQLAHVQQDLPQ